MSDLRQRVPGHSLIDQLLKEWNDGRIHFGATPDEIVIDEEARGWYHGVEGERYVAKLLEQLGPEWTVLHSIPAGVKGRDIDHIVVGPTGVFTINTKNSPGRNVWAAGYGLMVDGYKQNSYVQAAMGEIKQAEASLSRVSGLTVPVVGLIVFVAPRSVTRRAPSGNEFADVRVISHDELLSTILGRREFSPEQVARIVEAAATPSTWLARPAVSSVGTHISREFDALLEAVEPALGSLTSSRVQATPPRGPRAAVARNRHRTPSRPASTSSRSRRNDRKKPSRSDVLLSRVLMPLLLAAGGLYWLSQIGR